MKKHSSNRFCLNLLGLKLQKARPLVNLIMALSSHHGSKSVVELSLSSLYHYHYSGISSTLSSLCRDVSQRKEVIEKLQSLVSPYVKSLPGRFVVLHTDVTAVLKRYSLTLPGRGYVSIPNTMISGNKPLDVGYELSYVNLAMGQPGWSLPLSAERIKPDQTPADCALAQLQSLHSHPELGLADRLMINTADSAYGSPAYLSRSYELENLVDVVRLRHGRGVWSSFEPNALPRTGKGKSRPRVYGEPYYLLEESCTKTYEKHPKTGESYQKDHTSIFDKPADEKLSFESQTAKGRAITIELWRWNEMRLRTKRGYNMSNKPLDILACRITDSKTGKRVFDRDMFLAICGRKRKQLSSKQAFEAYRTRTDIEGYFRFAKQKLLLNKYQTPDIDHFDNWIICQILASWLLFTAKDEVKFIPRKWEQYLPKHKVEQQQLLSITQVQRAAQNLFLTFDQRPFLPLKSNKGRPRRKGEKQEPRKRFSIKKKTANWYNQKIGFT